MSKAPISLLPRLSPAPVKSAVCAVFHGPGHAFEIVDAPLRPLRQGELLVRNEFTTLCRSDINTFCGKRTEKIPTILGHEIVGRILEFGPCAPNRDSRGNSLRMGDRITWAIYAADPSSALARAGIPQKAPSLFKYGHEEVSAEEHHHGGLAECCILRRHTPLVRLQPQVPVQVAALINCSAATVAGAIRLAGNPAGKRVLITGAGMLGVFACAMCRAGDARRVIAADINPDRLRTALRFGAGQTLELDGEDSPQTGAVHADIHMDFSGDPQTVERALSWLEIGGVSVLVGATFPQRDLSLNAEAIVRGLLTIRGLHNYNEDDLITAVAFVEQHHERFPFTELVDDRFTLAEVNEAFDHAGNSGVYRVGIHTTRNP